MKLLINNFCQPLLTLAFMIPHLPGVPFFYPSLYFLFLFLSFFSTLCFQRRTLLSSHAEYIWRGRGDFINSNSSNSLLNMSKEKAINEISPVNSKGIYVLPNQSAQFNVSTTELIITLPKIL